MSKPNTPPEGAPSAGETQNQPTEPPAAPPESGAPPAEGGISNAELKSNPVFQKMASELGRLQKAEADRTAADTAAKQKAEQDALTAKGDFEAAMKLKDTQLADIQKNHAKELLERDLKLELSNTGFRNEMFVNGAVGSFTGESAGIADYVKELAAKEENKGFLGTATEKRGTLPEPNKPGSPTPTMSVDEARRLSKESEDPKVRQSARDVLKAEFDRTHRL
jgi:hypothetical protein